LIKSSLDKPNWLLDPLILYSLLCSSLDSIKYSVSWSLLLRCLSLCHTERNCGVFDRSCLEPVQLWFGILNLML
jgi:hypothetical protein